ncbi:MAG: ATP-binding protein [Thermoproteaceae archaeon]|nr:ATP-binding protein [Thermoproteaceae archaeon]
MRIGYVISASSPLEFIATLDPERPVSLYDYVTVEHVEYDSHANEYLNVRLLGQVVRIFRSPYSAKRDMSLYSVIREVASNILEVQIARVRVLGYVHDGELRQPKYPPRVGAPVYAAEDAELREIFKVERGLCVGRLVSRDIEICLDVNGIKRHVAVIAATGSGKTWFSVVLVEELVKRGAKVVVVDPHGEYVPIRDSVHRLGPFSAIVVRVSRQHAGDVTYRIGVLDSDPDAIANAAGVPAGAKKIRYAIYLAWACARKARETLGRPAGLSFMQGVLRTALRGEAALNKLLHQLGAASDFVRDDLMQLARRDRHAIFSALTYLRRLRRLGVFSSRSTPLSRVLADVTIVNLAGVNEEVQDYVVYHLLSRVFSARVRHVRSLRGAKIPWPVVVFVEEAHRFAPPKALRRTKSYEILSRVAFEGRKFGVYLVVVSQRPSKVDADIMSQCQSQVIMRVINPKDQEAIRDSSELLAQEFLENLPGLDVGEAVVLGPVVRVPTVIKLRDRTLDYGGADIDLDAAWRPSKALGAVQLWRRLYSSLPTPDITITAARLKTLRKAREGGRVVVTLLDGDREVAVVIDNGRPVCNACGAGRPCAHIYKALEEAVEVIRHS